MGVGIFGVAVLALAASFGEPMGAPDYPHVRVYRDLAYGPRKDLPDEGAGCPHTSLGKRYLPGTMANTHRSGQSFDVYLPCERTDLKGDEPVMLYVHGGAWHWLGDKDGGQELFCWIAENTGYVVVSMNYILQPFDTKQTPKRKEATFGAMLGDIDLCVSHLKRVLPEQFGIPVERIAIGGESAGGHLASLYAYDEAHPDVLALGLKHELKIGYLLNHCGAIDLTTPLIEHEFPNDPMTMEYRRRFSPINMIRKGSAPTLFVYSSLRPGAEGDGAIPVENFTTATNLCAQAGVEYRVHFNPQCPHAGTLSSRRPEGRRWLKDSLRNWRGKLK